MVNARASLSALVVGCSTAIVCAQAEVRIVSDQSELLPGESTVVSMYAAFPPTEFAFGAIFTDLLASTGSTGWSDLEVPRALHAPGWSEGTPTTMGIEGIIAGQVYFPVAGPEIDLSNPILFWQATYTAPLDITAPFDVYLTTQTGRFEVYISPDSSRWRSYVDVLVEGEATIRVVPAPAPFALLLMGGALVHRRRRSGVLTPPPAPPTASSASTPPA
ncbi:MAG: hypothetical protein KIT54_08890 [Phycisphaeraceae bacterium]|nr:hypothetical protein [Phycisphaeraceae bacterium]